MLPGALCESFVGALQNALGADVDPRPCGHLSVHREPPRLEAAELVPGGPTRYQVSVRDQDPGGLLVGPEHPHRLPALHQEGFVVLQSAERSDDALVALPVTRCLAAAPVDDQLVGPLGDLRIEVVHHDPERGLLVPPLAGQGSAAGGGDRHGRGWGSHRTVPAGGGRESRGAPADPQPGSGFRSGPRLPLAARSSPLASSQQPFGPSHDPMVCDEVTWSWSNGTAARTDPANRFRCGGRGPGGQRGRPCLRASLPGSCESDPRPGPADVERRRGRRGGPGCVREGLAEAGHLPRRVGLRDLAPSTGGERAAEPARDDRHPAQATCRGGSRAGPRARPACDPGDRNGHGGGDRPAPRGRPTGVRAARRRRVPARGDRGHAGPGDRDLEVAAPPSPYDPAAASRAVSEDSMSDVWTDRLSEYLDDELSPGERVALEGHLAQCAECSATLADLRRVLARARALESTGPMTDLWPGIAAGIGP